MGWSHQLVTSFWIFTDLHPDLRTKTGFSEAQNVIAFFSKQKNNHLGRSSNNLTCTGYSSRMFVSLNSYPANDHGWVYGLPPRNWGHLGFCHHDHRKQQKWSCSLLHQYTNCNVYSLSMLYRWVCDGWRLLHYFEVGFWLWTAIYFWICHQLHVGDFRYIQCHSCRLCCWATSKFDSKHTFCGKEIGDSKGRYFSSSFFKIAVPWLGL